MIILRLLFFITIFSLPFESAYGAGKGGSYVVGRPRMERILTGYLAERFNIPEEGIKLGSFRYHPMHLKNPPEEIAVEERRGGGRGKKLLLRVTFALGNKMRRNSFISLPFKMFGNVVVSKKKLKRGDVLSEGDFHVKEVWVEYGEISDISPSFFKGKELLRSLDSGEPLKKKYVASVPVVRRGDLVTLLFEKNGIRIKTRGVVRGEGSPGEMVKVLSSFSKKIVVAKVLTRELLSVDF